MIINGYNTFDDIAPKLESVQISPLTINGSGQITMKVGMQDNENGSGMQSVQACLKSPVGSYNLCPSLTINEQTNLWEGTATIENYHSPGEWAISFIHGRDKAGNYDDIKFSSDISTEFLVSSKNKITGVPSISVNVIQKE